MLHACVVLGSEKLIGQDLEVVCDSDNDRDHCTTFPQTIPDICCVSCINLFCVRYQIRVSAWEHNLTFDSVPHKSKTRLILCAVELKSVQKGRVELAKMKEFNSTTLVLMVAGFLLQLMISGINGLHF